MSDINSEDTIGLTSKSNSPIDIDKGLLQDIIGSASPPECLTDPVVTENYADQDVNEKTNEHSEQTNSKTSRELKLLLALSKEANLDTNISYKRKTLEGNKLKDKEPISRTVLSETDTKKVAKVAHENKTCRYPVTAESELELELPQSEVKNVVDNSNKTSKRKRDSLSEVNIGGATEEIAKRNRKSLLNETPMPQTMKDTFCWRCHRDGTNISCETCPRSYHQKCLKQTIGDTEHWPCPECVSILKAESTQTRSEAMKGMTLEHLCSLLKFAVSRMIQCQGSEPFLHPVNDNEFPEYKSYIIQPMDLTKIKKNIKENLYGSTQAFEADAKWLLHNSIIFNSYQSKLTTAAKSIVKICKQEMAEVENCPSCYLNANTKKGTWFVEVCPKPHLLVWAKLKGFPYWPAKAMCANASGMVDVRFFGAHDRAWVHHKECFLFSEKDPNTFKQKRYDIEKCVEELNIYIANLRKTYGEFEYAPYKTILEPNNETKQLQIFLPKYKTHLNSKKKLNNKNEALVVKLDLGQESKEIKTKDTLENTENLSNLKENNPQKDDENKNLLQNTDKIEMKENIPESKKNDLTLIQNETGIKANGRSPKIYTPTKYQDNDTTMEGYGTDDDNNTEIDMERRNTFIGKMADKISMRTDEAEGEEEDEEDSDTQVPSNISVDSTLEKSNIRRSQGGLNNSTGKIKAILRRVSDVDNNQKRQSTGDLSQAPLKVSRRNSDQSVKSDSSCISNISDRINRVDISEDMEVSLGNDDIGSISISENMSSNTSESSKSDYSVENKRKPVQVDIENSEFTIAPANKLTIADKLMKRLSDVEQNTANTTKVEDAKKSDIGKKSPTDILIEKFKGVVEHEIVDFNQPSTSSKEQVEENSEEVNKSAELSTTLAITDKAGESQNSDLIPIPMTNETVSSSEIRVNLPSTEEIALLVNNSRINQVIQEETTLKAINHKQNSAEEKEIVDNLDQGDKDLKNNKESLECDGEVREIEGINKSEISKTVSEKHKALAIEGPEEVPKKPSNFVQTSVTDIKDFSSGKHEAVNESTKLTNQGPVMDIPGSQNSVPSTSGKENSQKPLNTEVMNIIEEFEDNEEIETLDDIEIDKNNIFNIIHSSLNESKLKDFEEAIDANILTHVTVSSSKKRKLDSDDEPNVQSKLVKIVPIENILRKQIDKEKGITSSTLLQKSLQGKKMIRKPSSTSSTPSSISRRSSLQEIITEEIKSEPETDDDFSESENLEAKRKYLSALNILEKINDADKKLKANEIRTRSKTEEKREKFKVVDNLTKIIDDVALNYSAVHEGQEIPTKRTERRKSVASQEGEIFVKSFAKIPPAKHRARKSFPVPTYIKPNNSGQLSLLRKESSPNIAMAKNEVPKTITNVIAAKVVSSTSNLVTTQGQKALETGSNLVSHVILLPPNQTITYNNTLVNPVLSVVTSVTASTSTQTTSAQPIAHTLMKAKIAPLNVRASQNYIPQSESDGTESVSDNTAILSDLLNQPVVSSREHEQTENVGNSTTTTTTTTTSATTTTITSPTVTAATITAPEDEFSVLNSLLPENVSRAVSDLLVRPPPKLKPRPPGMLSTIFNEGIPSSAGTVTATINSVAHRLGDYFRGMLIETLEDLGKTPNPEAKITSLQQDIESLKFQHNVEISEIRKNVCTILKDIQRSILEDRDRIIEETRAVCEAETIKRVELAKSKQWCANCAKEAQFYCCWNTSYCDYPCQQKHWPKHLGKCTQNIEKSNNTLTPPNRSAGQQLILRPTVPPKPGMGRIVAKPTKVYMNRNTGPSKTFKTLAAGNLTVIETTPGNYELVGNGPIAVTGKFLATTSNIYHSKLKTTNVMTVTSPSTSGVSEQRIISRAPIVSTKSTTPIANTLNSVTTMLEDESD